MEKLEEMGPSVQKFVAGEVDKALSQHGLAYTSPLRSEIEARLEIGGNRDLVVRVLDDDGRLLTIDGFLSALRNDPSYAIHFPPQPPRVSSTDHAELRANFQRIANGEVVVS